MRPRLLFCAILALLGIAAATLVGACSTSTCSETLTCEGDASSEGGGDATMDSADGGFDAETDGTRDAATDASDALDQLDAPDARDAGPEAAACTCTPEVPTGFKGPVAFVEMAPSSGNASTPPPCTPPYSIQVIDGFNDPIAASPTCACTCGSVTGTTCSKATLETFTDNTCHNECNAILVASCTGSGCAGGSQSAIVTAPPPSGGSCAASVQSTVPAWNSTQDWGVTGRACASSTPLPEGGTASPEGGSASDGGTALPDGSTSPDGGSALPEGGCTATEVCAPSSPFGTSLCVWQAGVVPCPASYPNLHLLYDAGADTRSCAMTGCHCAAPTGTFCAVVATIASGATCSGATVLVGDAGSCVQYNAVQAPSSVMATITPSGGSCVPGGSSAVTGTVTPTGPITVCCGN